MRKAKHSTVRYWVYLRASELDMAYFRLSLIIPILGSSASTSQPPNTCIMQVVSFRQPKTFSPIQIISHSTSQPLRAFSNQAREILNIVALRPQKVSPSVHTQTKHNSTRLNISVYSPQSCQTSSQNPWQQSPNPPSNHPSPPPGGQNTHYSRYSARPRSPASVCELPTARWGRRRSG